MSILIKGMEMPNKKNGAVLIIYPDGKCAFEDGKTYQAVPAPDHGRLIDADALMERFSYSPDDTAEDRFWIRAARRIIIEAPTIIPADPAEEAQDGT